jgi:hypothetical protein
VSLADRRPLPRRLRTVTAPVPSRGRRLVLALLLLAPALAGAQGSTALDAPSRAAVDRIVDSARAAGLPTAPLELKAVEGAAKGAPGPRVVEVVRALAAALHASRAALGPQASAAELTAGAGAIQAGVEPGAMRRLQAAAAGRPVTVPLVVLADLVARGVPAPGATTALVRLARSGATDAALARLRADVVRDITAGVPAPSALSARLRANGLAPEGSPAPSPPPPGFPTP